MDTNVRTQLINTFNKGMDTDTSDALISNEAYRLANNLRYTTELDENTGELHMIPGANVKYIHFKFFEGDRQHLLSEYDVLATNTILNHGIIICKEKSSVNWFVLRIDSDDIEAATVVFGLCETSIANDYTNKLSTTMSYDGPEDIKLYIADGEHYLMSLNIMKDNEDNGSDIESILSTGNYSIPAPTVREVISGQLLSGVVQYAYVLYNKNSTSTNSSPLSKPISIAANKDGYSEGKLYGKRTSIGLQVEFTLDEHFEAIKVYRINYLQVGQLPTISCIYDLKYTYSIFNDTLQIFDIGLDSLQDITLEEFNAFQKFSIIPSIIESKNQYLFAANVKYDTDEISEAVLNLDMRAFSSGDRDENYIPEDPDDPEEGILGYENSRDNVDNICEVDNYKNINLDLEQAYDPGKWLGIFGSSNINGEGKYIQWLYIFDETLELSYDSSRSSINLDPLRFKNNIINKVKSLRRDEIYRYGIVFYSKSGIRYPVKWVADIRTPAIDVSFSNYGIANSFSLFDKTNDCIKLRQLGINFIVQQNESFPTEILNNISGFEIVRVNRSSMDRATITQGPIAGSAINVEKIIDDVTYSSNKLCSSGLLAVNEIRYGLDISDSLIYCSDDMFSGTSLTTLNYALMYTPEVLYQPDDLKLILDQSSNLYLQAVQFLYPITYSSRAHETDGIVYNIVNNSYENTNYGLVSKMSNDGYALGTAFNYEENWSREICNLPVSDEVLNNLTFNSGTKYYNKESLTNIPQDSHEQGAWNVDVNEYLILDAPMWNEFINTDGTVNIFDHTKSIDGKTYSEMVAPCLLLYKTFYPGFEVDDGTYGPTGIGERSLILHLPSLRNLSRYSNTAPSLLDGITGQQIYNITHSYCNYTFLCNLRRKIVPYNGFSKQSRENSVYYSHGCYKDLSGVDPSNLSVFDGDCFVTVFEFTPMHKWYNPEQNLLRFTTVYHVPVESDIDISLDSGQRFSRLPYNDATYVQDQPTDFAGKFVQTKPAYEYNTIYSLDTSVQPMTIQLNEELLNTTYTNRIHYSNVKGSVEEEDQWLSFQPLNYLDVSTKYGTITELREFKNNLMFWQEKAFGVLSVNERVQVATENNLPLMLGTGGVLDRYDYITTGYGMKANQFVDELSKNTLYWWDENNRLICAYSQGSLVVPLSTVKNVLNYINKYSNLGYFNESPLIVYDQDNNEIIFNVLNGSDKYNGSLIYNEYILFFTSMYTINPDFCLKFPGLLLLIEYSNEDSNKGFRSAIWNEESTIGGSGSKDIKSAWLRPYLKYVINDRQTYTKVYDNAEFAGRVYGGGDSPSTITQSASTLDNRINFVFKTPLKQRGEIDGTKITNRQYDFLFAIPRCGREELIDGEPVWVTKEWGDRLRGKTMQCEMSSTSNSTDFSLQYIITKYRISWS